MLERWSVLHTQSRAVAVVILNTTQTPQTHKSTSRFIESAGDSSGSHQEISISTRLRILGNHLTAERLKCFLRWSGRQLVGVSSLENSLILNTVQTDGLKCFSSVFNMICGWNNLQMWQKQHFVAWKWKLVEIWLVESLCSCKKWLPVINLMSERTMTVKTCCQVSSGSPGGSGQISN